ncbi:hypothetical protein BJL90_02110 [Clostridium formicaceticum]|nr:hypothetical protein BJL90_02110 [Clostridium formicaceticum]
MQFGVENIQKGQLRKKEDMQVDLEITSVIELIGELRGNICYSFSNNTAKKLVSKMMMGMPVEEMDEMAISAVAELTNMITGSAATMLSSKEIVFDITPPSIIFGEALSIGISPLEILAVDIQTQDGKIEVNIGLEKN